MVLAFRYSDDDGVVDEIESTSKWFWSTTRINHFHSKMVLAFRYSDDDGVVDEIEDFGNHFHSKMGLEYN